MHCRLGLCDGVWGSWPSVCLRGQGGPAALRGVAPDVWRHVNDKHHGRGLIITIKYLGLKAYARSLPHSAARMQPGARLRQRSAKSRAPKHHSRPLSATAIHMVFATVIWASYLRWHGDNCRQGWHHACTCTSGTGGHRHALPAPTATPPMPLRNHAMLYHAGLHPLG